jgi:hypothetical protein
MTEEVVAVRALVARLQPSVSADHRVARRRSHEPLPRGLVFRRSAWNDEQYNKVLRAARDAHRRSSARQHCSFGRCVIEPPIKGVGVEDAGPALPQNCRAVAFATRVTRKRRAVLDKNATRLRPCGSLGGLRWLRQKPRRKCR